MGFLAELVKYRKYRAVFCHPNLEQRNLAACGSLRVVSLVPTWFFFFNLFVGHEN